MLGKYRASRDDRSAMSCRWTVRGEQGCMWTEFNEFAGNYSSGSLIAFSSTIKSFDSKLSIQILNFKKLF